MNLANGKQQPGVMAMLVSVILATLLHLVNISPAAVLLCLAMWAYRLLALLRPLAMPGLALRTVAGAALFVVAVLTNEGLTVEAFVALLSLMISLKLFELERRRDLVTGGILCYFVIVSGMFFSDALLTTLYIALALIFNTAVLIHVQHDGMGFGRSLRLAGRLTVQATPFMLILFVLFPRIQGGLWRRPPQLSAKTGFSEEIAPGRIANLALSNDTAFRVHFDGPIPPPERLYWRGIVLEQFDGVGWKRGSIFRPAATRMTKAADTISYTLTLEPHQRPWLFSLDLPMIAPGRGFWLLDDFSLASRQPVTSRLLYQLRSSPSSRPPAREGTTTQTLYLPEVGNGQARNLAKSWRDQGGSDQAIMDRALASFRDNGFRYTLDPGPVGPDPANAIDRFLFKDKAGFCEHYASAFAFLMRAAGIPARLVGGYLGGRVNPYGDHLVVRQSDAHAWCEVLIDGQWLRIDPTAVVAPMRLHSSLAEVLGASGITSALSLLEPGRLPAWMLTLVHVWDLVDSRWNTWVMSYSFADQTRLFARFGINLSMDRGKAQLAVITILLLTAAFFLLLVLLRRKGGQLDNAAQAWLAFRGTLEQAGIACQPYQGPLDLLQQIEQHRPDLADRARAVIELYITLRYRRAGDGRTADDLLGLVDKFSASCTPTKTQ